MYEMGSMSRDWFRVKEHYKVQNLTSKILHGFP